LRGYKSAASETQVSAAIKTRMRFKRPAEFAETAATHTFINADGREQTEIFKGRDLAIMQEYRKDWLNALRENDASLLARYRHRIIKNAAGVPVFPATSLKTIRKTLDGMTEALRSAFMAEVQYLKFKDAA
jgi:hypothetical protein